MCRRIKQIWHYGPYSMTLWAFRKCYRFVQQHLLQTKKVKLHSTQCNISIISYTRQVDSYTFICNTHIHVDIIQYGTITFTCQVDSPSSMCSLSSLQLYTNGCTCQLGRPLTLSGTMPPSLYTTYLQWSLNNTNPTNYMLCHFNYKCIGSCLAWVVGVVTTGTVC